MSICVTDDEVAKRYPKAAMRDHVEKKAMWAGALEPIVHEDYYYENVSETDASSTKKLKAKKSKKIVESFVVVGSDDESSVVISESDVSDVDEIEVKATNTVKKKAARMNIVCTGKKTKVYTPTILKCFDEAVVNAADHATRNPEDMRELRIGFNDVGEVSVRNDGPGFEIIKHPTTNMYVPGQLVSEYLCGTNLDNDPENVQGGSHGIGIKLPNTHADRFTIETVEKNLVRHLYYKQTFTERNTVTGEPIVIDLSKRGASKDLTKEQKIPHTTITYQICYALLGYPGFDATDPTNKVTKSTVACYSELFLTRTLRMAAWFADKQVKVYFNDQLIPVNSLKDYAQITSTYCPVPWGFVATRTSKAKSGRSIVDVYPMNIVIGVKPFDTGYETFSIINGVITRADSCLEPIKKSIVDAVMDEVAKTKIFDEKKTGIKLQRKYVNDILFLFVTTHLKNPKWSSQTKESVPNMGVNLNYIIDASAISTVTNHVKTMLKEYVVPELLDNVKEKKPVSSKIRTCKYEKAKFAGTSDSDNCFLFLSEGDSAEGLIKKGMRAKGFPIKKERVGRLTLGGVIPNMRKEIIVKETKSGPKMFRSEMVQENGFVQTFEHALGLKFGTKYDETNIGELNYGKIVIATDQDTDGNFIKGLVCNMLQITSQKLIDGLVYVLDTPLIRAMPTKANEKVLEFSTQLEFEQWCEVNTGSPTITTPGYKIEYFKGLGGHNDMAAESMFSNFVHRLIKLHTDDHTEDYFNRLYGIDVSIRKTELCTAVVQMQPPSNDVPDGVHPWNPSELIVKKKTSKKSEAVINLSTIRHRNITNFLQHECKVFQLNNIERMLISAQDGMAETRKLILAGVIKAFRSNTKKKVCILSGEIMSSMNYTHGDASMCNGIIGMAQNFRGGRNIPLLRPLGQFGTMDTGGKDHASPRYVYVKSNSKVVNALYPREDDHLLKYKYEEGEKCQPVWFMPTIGPIFESNKIPATGWSQDVHARNVYTVIDNVRIMVNANDVNSKLNPMYIETYGFNGRIVIVDGIEYSIGCYEIISSNSLRITELPLKTWTVPYHATLKENKSIEVAHHFIGSAVDIEVTFKAGVLAKLRTELTNAGTTAEPSGSVAQISTTGDNPQSTNTHNEIFDPIIKMLGLAKAHKPILNLYDSINDRVVNFKNYGDILRNWYPLRRELYCKRVEREIIITELKIIRAENISRLLNIYWDLNLVGCTKAQLNTKLTDMKFQLIASNDLDSPSDIITENLRSAILGGKTDATTNVLTNVTTLVATNASYTYLSSQRVIDITVENREEQDKKIITLKERLAYLLGNIDNIIKETWLGEIDRLEEAIKEGRRTEWLFDDFKKLNI